MILRSNLFLFNRGACLLLLFLFSQMCTGQAVKDKKWQLGFGIGSRILKFDHGNINQCIIRAECEKKPHRIFLNFLLHTT